MRLNLIVANESLLDATQQMRAPKLIHFSSLMCGLIHDINRFSTVGKFLSYCRLVKGSHTSAGKNYGSPGKKIGNAHLKWAFGEAVPLLKRCSPEASAFADRIEKKRGKARAFSYLAVKLGRAVYYMLKRNEAFEIDRMLR